MMMDFNMDRATRLQEYSKEEKRLSAILNGLPKLDFIENSSMPISQEAANVSLKLGTYQEHQESDETLEIDEERLHNGCSWLLGEDISINDGSLIVITGDSDDMASIDVSLIDGQLEEFHDRFLERKQRLQLIPVKSNTNTYVRSPKSTPPKTPVEKVVTPKTRRRLTATIDATPALIPHLEHLSKTNNMPLSATKELRCEEGAPDSEAAQDVAVDATVKRQHVPESLIKRLEELKASNSSFCRPNNSVNGPKFRPGPMQPQYAAATPARHLAHLDSSSAMSVSQFMREIPDLENEEPESFLSLSDTSLLHVGHKSEELDLRHLQALMGEVGPRMTLGGVVIPKARAMQLEQFVGLDHTLMENRRLTMGGALLPTIGTPDLISLGNVAVDTFVPVDDLADENCNTDANVNGYSSKLFDATFSRNLNDPMNETFNLLNGLDLNGGLGKPGPEPHANNTFTHTEPDKQNATFVGGDLYDTFSTNTHNLTFTPPEPEVVSAPKSAFASGVPESSNILGKSYVKSPSSTFTTIEEKQAIKNGQYSTATYTRPTTRASPIKSGLPRRRGLSSEDLARSPVRSDGSLTPVDGKSALGTYTRNSPVTVMGTYTRNSPVERCGSEDERMSTTSDRSQDSVDDVLERTKQIKVGGKRSASTPRNSGISTSDTSLNDWQMSPISRHQSMSAASSSESIGRATRPSLHGMAPFKPTLIRPTDNFKRPLPKKTEVVAPKVASNGPVRPATARLATGLPQPLNRTVNSKVPSRLSAIPRLGAVRPTPAKKT